MKPHIWNPFGFTNTYRPLSTAAHFHMHHSHHTNRIRLYPTLRLPLTQYEGTTSIHYLVSYLTFSPALRPSVVPDGGLMKIKRFNLLSVQLSSFRDGEGVSGIKSLNFFISLRGIKYTIKRGTKGDLKALIIQVNFTSRFKRSIK